MSRPLRLGLRENAAQFTLLVLVNAFVGAMVGLERAVLPLLAEAEFGLASRAAILSFIASFGAAKAGANLLAGHLGDRYGRKAVLVAGWVIGLPVPLLVMGAPTWGWVVFANVLLGLNQGLAWSAAVVMKIDLVGPRQRGLAMGLNEAAGYLAVAGAALVSGYVAAAYALRPEPFYLGVALAVAGLVVSLLFVRDTRAHARLEADGSTAARAQAPDAPDGALASVGTLTFGQAVARVSWRDRTLFGVSQAGLVNNLNDGLAWGLLPLYFAALGYGLAEIGLLAALYPAVWGLGQLGTGALSDRTGRKPLAVLAMLVQAVGLALLLGAPSLARLAAAMALLGAGTALVYPTLLAAVADVAHPSWRSTAVGVYRLWRDSGYVAGALVAGLLADALGLAWAIGAVAVLTALSGLLAAGAMRETLPRPVPALASS